MDVKVYRNLHRSCYSVVDRSTGRVIAHADEVYLRDVSFVVRPGGRARVLREGRKNVHAFALGTLLNEVDQAATSVSSQIRYNPYTADHFVCNGKRIDRAPYVYLGAEGVFS